MKAFLLAAGEGTRLRPITNEIAKCLVPIGSQPLLGIWLEICRRYGIDEILINLHWKAGQVRDFVSQHGGGLKINCVEEERLLGSAGTVRANWEFVQDAPAFWIFYADVLTNADLGKMLASHQQRRSRFTMGLVETDEPRRCGIASLEENGRISAFEEKPEHPQSNWAFSGILLAGPDLRSYLSDRYPSDLGSDVLPRLAHDGGMYGHFLHEFLLDIGTLQNYQRVQKLWPGLTAPSQARGTGI